MTPLRILVVDDHPVVRHGLVALINHQADLHVVGEAATGRAAVEQFAALEPRPTIWHSACSLSCEGVVGLLAA
jgi:DNA-binding NarL/FixJ family response regulator